MHGLSMATHPGEHIIERGTNCLGAWISYHVVKCSWSKRGSRCDSCDTQLDSLTAVVSASVLSTSSSPTHISATLAHSIFLDSHSFPFIDLFPAVSIGGDQVLLL